MPYTKRKRKCKQSDGDSGNYVLSYTDKKGKKHRACHTSKKKMQGQIAAIEMESDEANAELIEETPLTEFISSILRKDLNEKKDQNKDGKIAKMKTSGMFTKRQLKRIIKEAEKSVPFGSGFEPVKGLDTDEKDIVGHT